MMNFEGFLKEEILKKRRRSEDFSCCKSVGLIVLNEGERITVAEAQIRESSVRNRGEDGDGQKNDTDEENLDDDVVVHVFTRVRGEECRGS